MNRRAPATVERVMVRQIVALVVGVLLTASVAEGSDLRRGSIVPRVGPIVPHGPNIVPNPPPERVPRHGHRDRHDRKHPHGHGHKSRHGHHHGIHQGFVFSPPVFYAAPRQCVTEGYWAYQWIPTSYTQSTWVPGGWVADGTWVEGRYEQRAYASGYYQPYWVPGQTYTC